MKYDLNLEKINMLMLQKGYSINKLSEESKVAKSTISRTLKNIGTQRASIIHKIVQALNVESNDLLK